MSDFTNKVLVSVEHSQFMHETGLLYGRQNAFNNIINKLLASDKATGANATGLDAVLFIMEMQKKEMEALSGEPMTSEQYDKEAKADHLTSEQFTNV